MLQDKKLPTLCTIAVQASFIFTNAFDPKGLVLVPAATVLISVGIFCGGCEGENTKRTLTSVKKEVAGKDSLDINSATSEELEILPHIGPKMAAKIVAHRARFGRFKRPEELMLVEGFSESRFMSIRGLVRAD